MIETLISLSAIDNRIVEVLKRLIQKRATWSESTLADASLIASLAIGVSLAFVGNVNALVAFPFLHVEPLIAIAFTGLLIGGGSSLIHEVLDILNTFKDIIGAPTVTVEQKTTTTPSGTTTNDSTKVEGAVVPPPSAGNG